MFKDVMLVVSGVCALGCLVATAIMYFTGDDEWTWFAFLTLLNVVAYLLNKD